jgi:uncharacterized protein (TIGR03437 family)
LLVTLSNPIHPKDAITIYATGLGRTSPAVETGLPAPADPLPSAIITPEVTLGGETLEVPTGMEVPLTVSQAGVSTTLKVRVVK